jgi:hypothetical protein
MWICVHPSETLEVICYKLLHKSGTAACENTRNLRLAALDRELSLADVWDVTDNGKDGIYPGL